MLEEYRKYKEEVLRALTDGKNLKLMSPGYHNDNRVVLTYTEDNFKHIRDSGLQQSAAYGDEDWGVSIKEAKIPRYNLREAYALADEDGKLYGIDLYKYLFNEALLCGGELSNTDKSKVPYDVSGVKTTLEEGVICLGISYFLDGRGGYIYERANGFFVLEDIDDDGIVVLPPGCQALLLLDITQLKKIKTLIMFAKDECSPAVFGAGKCYYVCDVLRDTIDLLDLSDIVVECYGFSKYIKLERYDDSRKDGILFKSNLEYAFNFKQIIYHLNSGRDDRTLNNKDIGNVNILNSLPVIPITINIDVYSSYLLYTSYADNTNMTLNVLKRYQSYYDANISIYSSSEDLNINIDMYGIDRVSFDTVKKVSHRKYLYRFLKPGMHLITAPHSNTFLCEGSFIFGEYIKNYNELRNKGVNVDAWMLGPNCSYGNSSTLFKESDIYDYDILKEMLVYYFLMSNYGNIKLDKKIIEELDEDNVLIDTMSKLFGVCKSTYGNLDYLESLEKFCTNEYVEIKEYNINENSLICEIGAGVQFSLTLLQLWLLRMSGLRCSQYVNFRREHNLYGAVYAQSNDDSRDKLFGYEALILSSKLGQNIVLKNGDESQKYDFFGCIFTNDIKESSGSMITIFSGTELRRNYNIFYILADKGEISKKIPRRYYEGIDINGYQYRIRDKKTTNKNIVSMINRVKTAKIQNKELSRVLGFVMNSKSCRLYGGLSVTGIGVSVYTSSKLPNDLVMDDVRYEMQYEVYKIKLNTTGDLYDIEGKTLYNLLNRGDLVSDNLNHTLIADTVVFLRDEYDREVTDTIQQMKGANLLFKDTEDKYAIPYSDMTFTKVNEGCYSCTFYNLGEELLLPSFITCAHELDNRSRIEELGVPYTEVQKVGIEVNNSEPIDVTQRINSLLEDDPDVGGKNSYSYGSTVSSSSVARKPGIEFYCSDKAYYTQKKPLVIYSVIANKLLELPRNMGIDFCYNYRGLGYKYIYEVPDVKVVVREGSEIYNIKSATEIDIADNCLIHNSAFSYSRLKTLIIHGGMIPENCCFMSEDFERIVVDGGNVKIHVKAMSHCKKFKGIECINGGSYTLIDADNAVVIRDLKDALYGTSDMSVFYEDLFDKIETWDNNVKHIGITDVIPYTINDDMTITLKHRDGRESRLSTSRIAKMLDTGCLNFKHTSKNNKELDFIEVLQFSKLRCLRFIPGINNNFCEQEVLVLLDTDRIANFDMMEDVRIVFAYQYKNWSTGKVKYLPLKYLTKEYAAGMFFDIYAYQDMAEGDRLFEIDSLAVCCHFWQNMYYYNDRQWNGFKRYYNKTNSYRPDESYYDIGRFKEIYFPASHEFSFSYKKQDVSGDKKNKVVLGGANKYAKCMHAKRYAVPLATYVNIIPGIGENCLMELETILLSDSYSENAVLWNSCKSLTIKTTTIINENACTKFECGYNEGKIHNILNAVVVTAPVKMKFGSIVSKSFSVIDTNLVIDCGVNVVYLNWESISEVQDFYISFAGESKFRVINLSEDLLDWLYRYRCINYALQLLLNSDEYDTLQNTNIGKKLLNISNVDENALDTSHYTQTDVDDLITVDIYTASKYDTDVVFEEEDLDKEREKELKKEDIIEDTLAEGVIPKLITLDYIEETSIEDLDEEALEAYSNLDITDADEDFLNLCSQNTENAQMLVDMCNVDVKAVQDRYDKQLAKEEEEQRELKELQEDKEREEAQKQQQEMLEILRVQDEDKASVLADIYKDDTDKDSMLEKLRHEYDDSLAGSYTGVVDTGANKADNVDNIGKADNTQDIANDMFDLHIRGEIQKGLASELKSGVLHTGNLRNRIKLIVQDEIMKDDKLLGYVVLNEETQEIKKLSVDNIKKLCLNLKYQVIGVRYNIVSNEVVSVL